MNEKIGIKYEKVVSFDEDERKTQIKTLKKEFEKYKHHDKKEEIHKLQLKREELKLKLEKLTN